MQRLNLTITAQAPLAIGQRKPGGSVSEASDYISGTVVRGAIAGKLLQYGTPEDGDDFHKLFVDESAAIFQNAYPAIAQLGDDQYCLSPGETRVLPATALSSKTDSGFKPKKAGVFDALIDSFCAREQGLFYEPNSKEGDRVEPLSGFYSKVKDQYHSHAVSKRLLTRVGINRRRATAQDEILYSLEVLNQTQGKKTPQATVYRGAILLEDPDLARGLCTFIQQNCDRFRLGGSASRGLGQVKITADLSAVTPDPTNVQQRLDAFNQCLDHRWHLWSCFGENNTAIQGKTFFTIDLASAAILTDNWRHTYVLSAELLRQLVAQPPGEVTLEMAYSSYDYRSGWNAAWGLPKDMELVTAMGSVFLFSVLDADKDAWAEQLAQLTLTGIGDRTNEGFGQIRVCDEFHQIMREEPV